MRKDVRHSLLTTRYSLFATRHSLPFLALTEGSCSRTTEIFRQCGSTALQKRQIRLLRRPAVQF
ncbi:hypothetical protein [Fervidibacter sp.]